MRDYVLLITVFIAFGQADAGLLPETPKPQGGDIVGSWVAEKIGLNAYVPAGLVQVVSPLTVEGEINGTITFGSDGKVQSDYTTVTNFSMVLLVPLTVAVHDTSRYEGNYTVASDTHALTITAKMKTNYTYTATADSLHIIRPLLLEELLASLPESVRPLAMNALSQHVPPDDPIRIVITFAKARQQSVSSQNSFSLSLDVNGSAGDQAATSVNVSPGQVVAIQIFGRDIQNANGISTRFEYDAGQVGYDGFDAGDVLPNVVVLPAEHGTNPTFVQISIGSLGGQATSNTGLVGTIRFRTMAAFSGTRIRLVRGELGRSGQFERVTLSISVGLQSDSAVLTPDFDGDGMVGFADFVQFAGVFGSSRGDGTYQAKYDLDSDGAIGFSDFVIFTNDFGKPVSPASGGGGGGGGGAPDLIVESPSVSDNTLTSGQSFTLRATVRNQGTGRSATTTLRYYRSSNATITTGDREVGTDAVSGLPASNTSAESIRLNVPSSAGTYFYGACVDDVSGESDTGNNCSTAIRITVTIVDDHGNTRSEATRVSLGSTTSGRLSAGDTDYFRVSVSGSGTLVAYTTGSTDTYGAILNSSGRVLTEDDDAGVGSNFYTSASVRSGTYYIRIRGYDSSTAGSYTLKIEANQESTSGTSGDFNIELVFVNDNDFTISQKAVFRQAARHWMSIITEDLSDIDFSTNPYNEWDADLGARIRVNDTVDDLRIFVGATSIDGSGDTLGRAGYFWIRGDTKLPILGKILLDTADLQRIEEEGSLWTVVLHEMGHVLGIGTLWDYLDLLRGRSDRYFTGALSIQAFNNAGGRNYNGAKVPTESDGGHWRASVFGNELMTPTHSYDANPLSAITIQSLSDLGYRVNVSRADAYSLPAPPSGKLVGGQSSKWGDCILKGPIYVSDENGRIIYIINE